MKWKASMYLLGGLSLALGSVLLAFSVVRAPVPPAAPPLSPADMMTWRLATMAMFGGATLMIAGLLALSRHWAGSESDGWGLLALAGGIIGPVGYCGATAAQWLLYGVGVANGLTPEMHGGLLMAAAGRIIAWTALISGGVALTKDVAFPKWLGLTGIVIGAGEIVADVVLNSTAVSLRWIWLAGFAWLFVLGLMVVMMRTALAAKAAEPAMAAAGH